jgi:hypothetical protein
MDRLGTRELFAPLPIAAVALMVINDRVLKPLLHNGLTGKLSDIAICFFLPLYTSALLGLVWRGQPRTRLLVGSTLATAVFTAQEVWTDFQGWFIRALRFVGAPLGLRHFTLTSDWTDLWALLVVPVAFVYGSRRLSKAARAQRPPL